MIQNKKMFFKKQKTQLLTSSGFTLIEILLVIAIIGILAGVLFVNMGGQRQRARGHAALQTVGSALPYLAECYLQNGAVVAPANNGPICNPSTGMTFPTLASSSTSGWTYDNSSTNPIRATSGSMTITCNYTTSVNCTKSGF